MITHEIGVVYKRNSQLFLAVTHDLLVSVENRQVIERTPSVKYKVCRDISVDELCDKWDISSETLDSTITKYFNIQTKRTRPKGVRRRGAAEEFEWREIRLARIVA